MARKMHLRTTWTLRATCSVSEYRLQPAHVRRTVSDGMSTTEQSLGRRERGTGMVGAQCFILKQGGTDNSIFQMQRCRGAALMMDLVKEEVKMEYR